MRKLAVMALLMSPSIARAQSVDAPAWQTPAPYAREDQVDEGTPDDAAHQADRAYTASLNRRNWPGRNQPVATSNPSNAEYRAELQQYEAGLRDYRAAQADYAQRSAAWQADVTSCRYGAYGC